MYCVRCGVKLQEGAETCPLCGTPVWNPDGKTAESTYNLGHLPDRTSDLKPAAIMFTLITVLSAIAITIICFSIYRRLQWGDYVLFSLLLFSVIVVLPLWFNKPNPVVFVPIDFAAIIGFLLFINIRTGGRWFLSFAFPCVGILGIIATATVALLKYIKKGRYCILGGAQIVLGIFCFLLEFFQHITFATGMFKWSLFAATALILSGIFLLCVGLIRPLRDMMNRVFFF